MSRVRVRIPMPLREFTAGLGEVEVEGATVAGALSDLERRHPGVLTRVLKPDGSPRPLVNIYRGTDNIQTLDGLDTSLGEGDVLSIVPAVAGG